jgi:hypothetical protein
MSEKENQGVRQLNENEIRIELQDLVKRTVASLISGGLKQREIEKLNIDTRFYKRWNGEKFSERVMFAGAPSCLIAGEKLYTELTVDRKHWLFTCRIREGHVVLENSAR